MLHLLLALALGQVPVTLKDGETYADAAFKRAYASLPAGGHIHFPTGTYSFQFSLEIDHQVSIDGETGAGWGATSILIFPESTTAIHITPTSGWSIISNLAILSYKPSLSGKGHGVWLEGGRASLEYLWIKGFGGHGVFISGAPSRIPPTNADVWRLRNIRIERSGLSGVYVDGSAANAGLGESVDVASNCTAKILPCAGIYDSSFILNTWVATHSTANYPGAGYICEGSSNKTSFFSPYEEGGQGPSKFAPNCQVYGGNITQIDGLRGVYWDAANPAAVKLDSGKSTLRLKKEGDRDFRWDINNLNSAVSLRVLGASGEVWLPQACTWFGTSAGRIKTCYGSTPPMPVDLTVYPLGTVWINSSATSTSVPDRWRLFSIHKVPTWVAR